MAPAVHNPKVLYQLVSPLHRTAGAAEVERRRRMLNAWTSPSAEVDIWSPDDGPAAVESAIDIAMVFPSLRPLVPQWGKSGYGAVVIGCFSDPGIEALRESTGVPIIGPGEASLFAAAQSGGKFSVLSSEPTPSGLQRRIRGMGLDNAFVSERLVGGSVSDLVQQPQQMLERITASARACVQEGADVLVLGCLAMSFIEGLPERLQDLAGVPVINPVVAGLKSAEAVIGSNRVSITRNASTGS
jgi:allantoin racemase